MNIMVMWPCTIQKTGICKAFRSETPCFAQAVERAVRLHVSWLCTEGESTLGDRTPILHGFPFDGNNPFGNRRAEGSAAMRRRGKYEGAIRPVHPPMYSGIGGRSYVQRNGKFIVLWVPVLRYRQGGMGGKPHRRKLSHDTRHRCQTGKAQVPKRRQDQTASDSLAQLRVL